MLLRSCLGYQVRTINSQEETKMLKDVIEMHKGFNSLSHEMNGILHEVTFLFMHS